MAEEPRLRWRDWFVGSARLRAEEVVALDELGDESCAVLDRAFPRSFDSNRIVIPAVPDRLDVALAIAAADEVLGGRGLAHREVSVYGPLPTSWYEALVGRGATAHPLVLMAIPLDGTGGGDGGGTEVVEVDEEQVAPFVAADWRESEPSFDDETVRQLVARRVRLDRAGRVQRLAVAAPDATADDSPARAAGGLAAAADLVVRGRTAGLDNVGTLGAYRGRGYGDSLVAAAVRRAAGAGCDLLLLEALADDWPREWYARRGFEQVGEAWALRWTPPAAPDS
jgi:GNAT superfamily N-acetyltransferase